MIIFVLWVASALAGLALGLQFFRVLVIVLASPCVAFLSVAVLLYHGFGLVPVVLVPIGSLTALQCFYFLGAIIWHLTTVTASPDISKLARSRVTAIGETRIDRL
jgi:hypothetical protein